MDKLARIISSVRDLTEAEVQAILDVLQARYLSIGPKLVALEGAVAAFAGYQFRYRWPFPQSRFIGEPVMSPIRSDRHWVDDLEDGTIVSLGTCDPHTSTCEVPVLPTSSSNVKRIDLQAGRATHECPMFFGITILDEVE